MARQNQASFLCGSHLGPCALGILLGFGLRKATEQLLPPSEVHSFSLVLVDIRKSPLFLVGGQTAGRSLHSRFLVGEGYDYYAIFVSVFSFLR